MRESIDKRIYRISTVVEGMSSYFRWLVNWTLYNGIARPRSLIVPLFQAVIDEANA